jgi:Tol biopolymer transport system component
MVNAARRFTVWVGLAVLATLVLAGFGGSEARRFGGTIAFVARNGDTADLYVIGADGTWLRQLTHDAREELSPTWAPDGKSIAVIATTFRLSGQAISAITVVARNGSRRRVLFRARSSHLTLYDLAWSARSTNRVYVARRHDLPGLAPTT